MTIGEGIKEARKNKGLSQQELGDMLGVSQAMIAQYENGKRVPKIETLERIANALGGTVLYTEKNTHHIMIPGEGDLFSIYPALSSPEKRQKALQKRRSFERLKKFRAYYDELNENGQRKTIEYAKDLTKIPEYRKETKSEKTEEPPQE